MEQHKIWTEFDARCCIAIPIPTDDKYSRGVLGIIAGSREYPGAAVLTCEGAMATGVGMIRYLGPRIARMLVLHQRPEIVLQPGQVQTWLIGPGIERAKIGWRRRKLIRNAMSQQVPVILDAGGISFASEISGPTLITPHFRELALLLTSSGHKVSAQEIQNDPVRWARFTAEQYKVTVLLKGNQTIVASKESTIELPAASAWLATAGTGDVLSGILGALIATHSVQILELPAFLANLAATGSMIHSQAALIASRGGPVTAHSLSRVVPQAISKLLNG